MDSVVVTVPIATQDKTSSMMTPAPTPVPIPENHLARIRRELGRRRAYMSWSAAEDEQLVRLLQEGVRVADAAVHLARTLGAVRSRIRQRAAGRVRRYARSKSNEEPLPHHNQGETN